MIPSGYPLPAARANMADLSRALQAFRAGQRAKYGIYVEDLHSGLSVNLDGDDRYIAASTTKFPVSLYAFYHAAQGELDLMAEVEYLPGDKTGGTGVIQHAPFGTRYTIRQLCYHAIVDSDNVAWHMLYRALGEPAIKAWMRSIGGRHAIAGINVAAPTDYAVYAKFLLEFADRHPGLGGTLIDWLKAKRVYSLGAQVPTGFGAHGAQDWRMAYRHQRRGHCLFASRAVPALPDVGPDAGPAAERGH